MSAAVEHLISSSVRRNLTLRKIQHLVVWVTYQLAFWIFGFRISISSWIIQNKLVIKLTSTKATPKEFRFRITIFLLNYLKQTDYKSSWHYGNAHRVLMFILVIRPVNFFHCKVLTPSSGLNAPLSLPNSMVQLQIQVLARVPSKIQEIQQETIRSCQEDQLCVEWSMEIKRFRKKKFTWNF